MEDAVDLIVQAAVEDLPFPEESYEVLDSQPGGVDLIIGARCGKKLYPFLICQSKFAKPV